MYCSESTLNDPSVVQWLNEFTKVKTQRAYRYGLSFFCDSVQKGPGDLCGLSQKDLKMVILNFQKSCVDEGLSTAKILNSITAVRSYLAGQEVNVVFRRCQIVKKQSDISSHVFSNGDLCRLIEVGGAFEKALLATACSQGWEVSMFLRQERKKIADRIAHADQNGLRFIYFMDRREKTGGTPRFCVLNPLAVDCLKRYLAVRKDDDPRLFPITADGVQKMLYRLARDADLKTTGALRFHNIRKWLMSRLSRCQFNEFQIKFIMGKSIALSDLTYLQTLQDEIEEKYPRVYNDYLNVCWKPGGSAGAVSQMFTESEAQRLLKMLAAFEAGKIEFKA